MTHAPGERPISTGDAPAEEIDAGDVSERLDTDPEAERNRTDPQQESTQDHPH